MDSTKILNPGNRFLITRVNMTYKLRIGAPVNPFLGFWSMIDVLFPVASIFLLFFVFLLFLTIVCWLIFVFVVC